MNKQIYIKSNFGTGRKMYFLKNAPIVPSKREFGPISQEELESEVCQALINSGEIEVVYKPVSSNENSPQEKTETENKGNYNVITPYEPLKDTEPEYIALQNEPKSEVIEDSFKTDTSAENTADVEESSKPSAKKTTKKTTKKATKKTTKKNNPE